MDNNCEHKFVYMETIKKMGDSGSYQREFIKVDRFFCEKCLMEKEIEKREWSRETPLWY